MDSSPKIIRNVAVITSGGDSPGFNPCIRAVVRMALHEGWSVYGVQRGFEGLTNGELIALNSRSVSGIISQGGTILGSGRWESFKEAQNQRRALRTLNERGIDALVVIGGDGSMCGALALHQGGMCVIGVPGTIENDVFGTDLALGVDTALNTALEAMDRIKDTASAQQQVFLVELMGERSGYLTLMAGIAGGAEMVCIPEVPCSPEDVVRETADAYIRGKKHCIITVAEGARPHAAEIAHYLQENQERTGFGVRLSILGHIMRGGSPSAYDRYLGTLYGAEAIRLLSEGSSGVMIGLQDNQLIATPLTEVTSRQAQIEEQYLSLARILAK
ncbi:MAG: 6-phosphofructokinase [Chloroflexi bacterium]|nr:6-phosphofructokinase [Chloroflexota bacterium]